MSLKMYSTTDDYYNYYDYNRAIIIASFLLCREKIDAPKSDNYSKWSYFTEKIHNSEIVGGTYDIFFHISNLLSKKLIDSISVFQNGKESVYTTIDEINILRDTFQNSLNDVEIRTEDIDFEMFNTLIAFYLEQWKNPDGIFGYCSDNFLGCEEQLKALKSVLKEKFRENKSYKMPIERNEVGRIIKQCNNIESTVDILGCVFYLQSQKELKILDVDISDTVHFYLEISPKILQKIFFDAESGKVYVDEQEIGQIKVGNQEYKLFKYLYDNAGIYKTHDEIKEFINPGERMLETNSQFVANKKRQLDEPIRELIHSGKGNYVLSIM